MQEKGNSVQVLIAVAFLVLCGGFYLYSKGAFAFVFDARGSSSATASSSLKFSEISQYTDPSFGFSFWYPNGWMVSEVSVKDRNKYEGGTIGKQLDVSNGRSLITIEEYSSPTHSITDSTGVGACPVCVTTHYYFNSGRNIWMVEFPDGTPSGLYAGNPYAAGDPAIANTSLATMGGLQMFAGSDRFGGNVVIPLTVGDFLIVTVDGKIATESADPQALAKTIVALDPAAAVPLGSLEQAQAVEAEAKAYDGL